MIALKRKESGTAPPWLDMLRNTGSLMRSSRTCRHVYKMPWMPFRPRQAILFSLAPPVRRRSGSLYLAPFLFHPHSRPRRRSPILCCTMRISRPRRMPHCQASAPCECYWRLVSDTSSGSIGEKTFGISTAAPSKWFLHESPGLVTTFPTPFRRSPG